MGIEAILDGLQEKGKFGMIGLSPGMQRLYDDIARIAPSDVWVHVRGESGTGKEKVAEAIHANSSRKEGPLVRFAITEVTPSLVESELFGHKKGSFTHAIADKQGRFEQADRGTLFLDEIADMSQDIQVKVLRMLDSTGFTRVGDTQLRQSDFRMVVASSSNLMDKVLQGVFREDFYFRLPKTQVYCPPLRERGEDILVLAEYFKAEYCRRNNIGELPLLSAGAKESLMNYEWPGNVRELRTVIENSFSCTEPGAEIARQSIETGFSYPLASAKRAKAEPAQRTGISDTDLLYHVMGWLKGSPKLGEIMDEEPIIYSQLRRHHNLGEAVRSIREKMADYGTLREILHSLQRDGVPLEQLLRAAMPGESHKTPVPVFAQGLAETQYTGGIYPARLSSLKKCGAWTDEMDAYLGTKVPVQELDGDRMVFLYDSLVAGMPAAARTLANPDRFNELAKFPVMFVTGGMADGRSGRKVGNGTVWQTQLCRSNILQKAQEIGAYVHHDPAGKSVAVTLGNANAFASNEHPEKLKEAVQKTYDDGLGAWMSSGDWTWQAPALKEESRNEVPEKIPPAQRKGTRLLAGIEKRISELEGRQYPVMLGYLAAMDGIKKADAVEQAVAANSGYTESRNTGHAYKAVYLESRYLVDLLKANRVDVENGTIEQRAAKTVDHLLESIAGNGSDDFNRVKRTPFIIACPASICRPSHQEHELRYLIQNKINIAKTVLPKAYIIQHTTRRLYFLLTEDIAEELIAPRQRQHLDRVREMIVRNYEKGFGRWLSQKDINT